MFNVVSGCFVMQHEKEMHTLTTIQGDTDVSFTHTNKIYVMFILVFFLVSAATQGIFHCMLYNSVCHK